MKKNNRKGFTIVELVIVIAVIAILAGVLIPTFGSIIDSANENAALQKARNMYTVYLNDVKANPADLVYIEADDYYFQVVNGELKSEPVDADDLVAGTILIKGDMNNPTSEPVTTAPTTP